MIIIFQKKSRGFLKVFVIFSSFRTNMRLNFLSPKFQKYDIIKDVKYKAYSLKRKDGKE